MQYHFGSFIMFSFHFHAEVTEIATVSFLFEPLHLNITSGYFASFLFIFFGSKCDRKKLIIALAIEYGLTWKDHALAKDQIASLLRRLFLQEASIISVVENVKSRPFLLRWAFLPVCEDYNLELKPRLSSHLMQKSAICDPAKSYITPQEKKPAQTVLIPKQAAPLAPSEELGRRAS